MALSIRRWLVIAGALGLAPVIGAQEAAFELLVPQVALSGVPVDVGVNGPPEDLARVSLQVGSRNYAVLVDDAGARFPGVVFERGTTLRATLDGALVASADPRVIPGWLSIVPPLLAIAIALAFKQVIPALFLGLWVGATTLVGFGPLGWLNGLINAFWVFVLGAVTNPAQAQIVLFSFMIGGTVGIVIKNGGMQGVVNLIVQWATDPRRGQLTTAVLGVVIFFDDYANTLVVGNTMRQVTDRLRISREKLAYIVDSTAAPVACVALVTTWIGYEVGLIGNAVGAIDGITESAYSIFLRSIPYSFYPFMTMFLVFTLATLGRDFGPMHAAEVRARTTGKVLGDGARVDEAATGDVKELRLKPEQPQRAFNAIIPIGVLIGGVLAGLYFTGSGDTLRQIVDSSDSYAALMWGSILGAITAAVLSVAQRILTMDEVVDAWYAGVKQMLYAMIILVLAWSLAGVSTQLGTAGYMVSVMGEALSPAVVPSLVFVLAAATAFATGSSWATMGILMPLVVPLVWAVMSTNGVTASMHIFYSTIACVLAGAVLGDHCSPISDTTILSSMASGCDHIEHVRTQLPYAMTVGAVAILFGSLPVGFGLPWWLGMLFGGAVLWAVARYLGRPVAAA